jgi:hypothetical protein
LENRCSTMLAAFAIAGIGLVPAASADPIVLTTGAGSAVSRVDAVATFKTQESLGHTFVEGGLRFTRVNLSNNNNGCGFAGCSGDLGFTGFHG